MKGITFDSSLAMMEAAIQGAGVALAPPQMFSRYLVSGEIRQPFNVYTSIGSYWLTRLKSRSLTPVMSTFQDWLLAEAANEEPGNCPSLPPSHLSVGAF
jgi:LysR family transcriptional regulator of beta-lactamase